MLKFSHKEHDSDEEFSESHMSESTKVPGKKNGHEFAGDMMHESHPENQTIVIEDKALAHENHKEMEHEQHGKINKQIIILVIFKVSDDINCRIEPLLAHC